MSRTPKGLRHHRESERRLVHLTHGVLRGRWPTRRLRTDLWARRQDTRGCQLVGMVTGRSPRSSHRRCPSKWGLSLCNDRKPFRR